MGESGGDWALRGELGRLGWCSVSKSRQSWSGGKRRRGPVFRRIGRSLHLEVSSAEDVRGVVDLDEAHWMAINAPVESFHVDRALLEYMDLDGDGRIKVGEFKASVRWLFARLKDYSGIERGSTEIVLDALDEDDAKGRLIGGVIRKMAREGRIAEEGRATLAEIRTLKGELERSPVSAAGVVTPDATGEEDLRRFLEDVIRATGGVEHPAGSKGVDHAILERFRSDGERLLEWARRARVVSGQVSDVMPLGVATPQAWEVLERLRNVMDDFYVTCRVVGQDPSLKGRLWPVRDARNGPLPEDTDGLRKLMLSSPLAEPNSDGVLDFGGRLNVFYRDDLEALRKAVLAPLIGAGSERLSEGDWEMVKERFKEYGRWLTERPEVGGVGEIETDRLEEYLQGDYIPRVEKLIEGSRKSAFDLQNVKEAEKLALLQGYIRRMVDNYVGFPDLYDPKRRALFEEGTLVMDGREFSLAVRVPDRAEHRRATAENPMFTMYVEIEQKGSGRKMEVAVPVTSGTQGNLVTGKRGVFMHVDGTEWSARVVDIVDHPISLREAMWAPFERLGTAVTRKIEALTSAAEKKVEDAGAGVVRMPAGGAAGGPPGVAGGGMGSVLAGGGIAIAALGSSAAFIFKTLAGLRWWQILGGVAAALLAYMIPAVILAGIRLRQRDLSCILEGAGWGINGRMRLTLEQRRTFTRRPAYPAGTRFRPVVSRAVWLVAGGALLLWGLLAILGRLH